MSAAVDSFLESAPDDMVRACLLAVSTKESGAWLQALPVSNLGIRIDGNTMRVAVGFLLGSSLCHHHTCQYCGADLWAQL